MKLGPILRKIRLFKNIPQKNYAKLLGLSPAQMSKLELGKCEPLEGTTLKMLKLLLPEIDLNKELYKAEIQDIIYPNVSIKNWIKKHPELKRALPLKCLLCNALATEVKAFLCSEIAGMEGANCSCGAVSPAVYIPISKRKCRLYRNLFNSIVEKTN